MTYFKINHIAVVVENIHVALAFWRDTLGLPLQHVEHNTGEAVDIAFLPTGDAGEIELIAPFTTDSGIATYLAKKGAGLHHLCLDVDDLDAALARLRAANVELITEQPRIRPCLLYTSDAADE